MTIKNKDVKEKKDFKKIAKEKYDAIYAEIKNPIKRKVAGQKVSAKSGAILRGIIIFLLSFMIVFPIFRQFTFSIRDPLDLNNPLVNFIPERFSLINFQIASELLIYWKALFNNIQVSAITTVFQIASTAIAGYAFARLKFRGSNILFWIIMLTLILPPQTVALSRSLFIGNFDIFGSIGIFNNGSGLDLRGNGKVGIFYLLAATGQGIRAALFIFIFRQFFRGIPVELEESAQIDGAGIVRTFWSVMLPNARGAITTVALFAFVWQWNDVFYVRLYQIDSEAFPMMTVRLTNIAEWIGNLLKSPQYRHLLELVGEDVRDNPHFTSIITNSAALLMMLPLLIAYLFVQKLFIEGIERTGIVG